MSLDKASQDLKYLLDRNYTRTTAINLVVNRYKLSEKNRNLLHRYVFPEKEIRAHRKKLCPLRRMRGKKIVIDGYNVLITVEAVLEGKDAILGMDGILRDVKGIFSKYKFDKNSEKATDKILEKLKKFSPSFTLFIFDSQISKSGELAAFVRERMEEHGLTGDAITSPHADKEIKKLNCITLSSDSIIIENVDRVIDLPSKISRL